MPDLHKWLVDLQTERFTIHSSSHFQKSVKTYTNHGRSALIYFKPEWYDRWDFICYDPVSGKAFCWICEFSLKKAKFSTWRSCASVNGQFNKHLADADHLSCVSTLIGEGKRLARNPISIQSGRQVWIGSPLGVGPFYFSRSRSNSVYSERKIYLERIVNLVGFFLSRGLPLYGNSQKGIDEFDPSNSGNFMALIYTLSRLDKDLLKIKSNEHAWLGVSSISEIVNLYAIEIQRAIRLEMGSVCDLFSFKIDGSSHYYSLAVRYLVKDDTELVARERVIDFSLLESGTAETQFDFLKKFFQDNNLSWDSALSWSGDYENTNKGLIDGLNGRIRRHTETALMSVCFYLPDTNHRVQICAKKFFSFFSSYEANYLILRKLTRNLPFLWTAAIDHTGISFFQLISVSGEDENSDEFRMVEIHGNRNQLSHQSENRLVSSSQTRWLWVPKVINSHLTQWKVWAKFLNLLASDDCDSDCKVYVPGLVSWLSNAGTHDQIINSYLPSKYLCALATQLQSTSDGSLSMYTAMDLISSTVSKLERVNITDSLEVELGSYDFCEETDSYDFQSSPIPRTRNRRQPPQPSQLALNNLKMDLSNLKAEIPNELFQIKKFCNTRADCDWDEGCAKLAQKLKVLFFGFFICGKKKDIIISVSLD